MAYLKVVSGQHASQIVPLEGARIVLGRHPQCQVRLEDGSVSREHAQITWVNGQYLVEDLKSRNGTLLNGQPVVVPQVLRENDQLSICDLVFSFHDTPVDARPLSPGTTIPNPKGALVLEEEASLPSSTMLGKLDVSSSQSGFRISIRPEAKLRALLEVTENLSKALALDDVLLRTIDSLFKIFVQADRGFVVLRGPDGRSLIPRAVKHRRGEGDTVRISRTIVEHVMQTQEAILSADAANDARFDMSQSVADFRIRSMMCAPLITGEGQVLGVLQIDTTDQRSRFQQEDLDVLAAVARQAAIAVENAELHETALRQERVDRDLALARQVQQGFLPSQVPDLDGYAFFAYYEAANQLGGDYYDYVPLPGGRLGVVLADVSGKGIAAALVMAKLASEVRYSLASEPDPAQAVDRLSAALLKSGWEDRFVTLVLAVLDPAEHRCTLVNAGHMPPYLRGRDGRVRPVGGEAGGLPLGIADDFRYEAVDLPLARGDTLVIFTDGISEALNGEGELYGLERLRDELTRAPQRVDELGRHVLEQVRRFVGQQPQSDDICLSCFGRL